MSDARRFELDWLRVIAFGILIYFHAAVFFIPGGLPLIQNGETSKGLGIFVEISSQFRLALLFFISGAGVYFARRRRTERAFISERSTRLLVPLLFSLVVVVPPMVYTEKLFLGEFSGSFFEFYPLVFTTGVYPSGNLSWHHLWFVAYLYLFCLLAIMPLRWLAERGEVLLSRVKGVGIYGLMPVLIVPEWILRWQFPGFRDLIHDWASFVLWFLVFIAGYCVASRMRLIDDVVRYRWVSLLLAASTTLIMLGLWADLSPWVAPGDVLGYLVRSAMRIVMIWSAILACLGFAGRYLTFGGPSLSYLNEAVYPLFILHLPALVILGYFIVPLEWSLWTKFWVLTSATILSVLLLYQLLIRPFNLARLCFGVKSKSNAAPASKRQNPSLSMR